MTTEMRDLLICSKNNTSDVYRIALKLSRIIQYKYFSGKHLVRISFQMIEVFNLHEQPPRTLMLQLLSSLTC